MISRKYALSVVTLCSILMMAQATSAASYSGTFSESVPEANASGVTSTISISDAITLSSLVVNVEITHSWIGDLAMVLTAPDGTSVTLLDRPGLPPGAGLGACCGSGADLLGITFDDAALEAAENIVSSTNLTPVVSPNELLGSLVGLSIAGEWSLTLIDFAQGQMNTNIPSWTLTFNESVQPVPLPGALGFFLVALAGLCRRLSPS